MNKTYGALRRARIRITNFKITTKDDYKYKYSNNR